MRYIIAILLTVFTLNSFGQGFPSIDSLRSYNTKYTTNSALLWFQNLRGQTLLRGIIDRIDSVRLGGGGGGGTAGIDSLYALNDSTIRYRRSGTFYNFYLRGVYDFRKKVDTIFKLNDSTLRYKINGVNRDVAFSISGGSSNTYSSGLEKSGSNVKQKLYTTIYDNSFWDSLTGFTATGFTPTISSSSIQMTGGAGNFNQYLSLNNNINADETFDFQIIVKATNILGSAYGVGIGKKSINSWYGASLALQLSYSQNWMKFWDAETATEIAVKSVPTISANNIIRLRYIQRGGKVTAIFENITTGDYVTFSVTSNFGTTKNFKIPNTGKYTIWNFGGTSQIMNVNIRSAIPFAPDVVCIGDSKTFGYSSTNQNLRFSSLLNSLGSVVTYAGDGDRTVEMVQAIDYIKAFKPKYALLCIGRNDLGSSVSYSTWQTNYQNIVTNLTNAGITVVHLYGIEETNTNQDTLWKWINNTYSSNKLNIAAEWNNTTMLSTDNVHPNELGHRFIAKNVLASGYIPAASNNIPEISDMLPQSTGGSTAVNGNNYVPISNGSAFNNSSIYGASSTRYSLGTTSPYNYGSGFTSFEVNGSEFGLLSVGAAGTTTKSYWSIDNAGTTFFGINNNGTFKNAMSLNTNGNAIFGDVATNMNGTAAVEIVSTTKGFLPPRMTSTQRDAITTPATGLMIFNTTTTKLEVYTGSAWQAAW